MSYNCISTDAGRTGLFLLLLLASLAALFGCPGARSQTDDQIRHVIFISLDTTRPDHIGCYGNDWARTPCLDQLARESVLLLNHRTVVSATLPSHLSLLTGNYPHTHGVVSNGYLVNPENLMMAEILEDAGFHTAGFLGSFALESRFHFDQGFDHFDEDFDVRVGTFGADQNQRSARMVTDAVINHLQGRGGEERLFLFIHYFDPHAPHTPPPPFDTMYGPDGATDVPGAAPGDGGGPPLGEKFNRARRSYAGEISYMDDQLGRLIDHLRESGILDRSMLVVTSDHGENIGEHGGMISHGWSTYGTEMDAVGLIRLPGAARAGMEITGLTASIDILPTVLDRLEMPAPPGIDGQRIELDNAAAPAPPRVRFGEAVRAPGNAEMPPAGWPNFAKMVCVWDGDFKFQMSLYRKDQALYDLSRDPHETRNLLRTGDPRWQHKAEELRRLLGVWNRAADPLPSRFDPEQLADTTRRLKALGYLE
jgi:arylsulfatase A-like enzyme